MSVPRLSFRIDLPDGAGRVGPGKVRLLELIERHGSISEAARAMRMSYRRAWLLVDDLNRLFAGPLVQAAAGGRSGGGARLTAAGRDVVRRYRAIEDAAGRAAAADLRALEAMTATAVAAGDDPPPRPPSPEAPGRARRGDPKSRGCGDRG